MNHVAIMSKSFGDLIAKILSGEKTIESRWSKNKIAPYNKIEIGDTVYFKNSGEPVIARANVSKIRQFDNLDSDKVKDILKKWGGQDGIAVDDIKKTYDWAKNKKYCVLIWLKNPKRVDPFQIDKSGFGSGCAWLSVPKIWSLVVQPGVE